MRLRPVDALVFACFFAALAAMMAIFRGEAAVGALLFLAAFVADALHALAARAGERHRLGAELDDVVELVAFSLVPALVVHAAFASWNRPLAIALGAVPLVTGTVRLALHAVRPLGTAAVAFGLPRSLSALFAVALCRSSAFELEAVRHGAVGLLPLVAILNIAPIPLRRPFVHRPSRAHAVVLVLSAAAVGVGFALGHGFDALLAWAGAALVAGPILAGRPVAARAGGA